MTARTEIESTTARFPFDAVLGYHMNPMTCGIAKFNSVLARRLGVPFLNVFAEGAARSRRPLLSIKASEFGTRDRERFAAWLGESKAAGRELVLFIHAFSDTPLEHEMIRSCAHVYCGNELLSRRLAPLNERVSALWCPGTNLAPEPYKPAELTVFSFGMAHKVRADKYRRLYELLEATGKSYVLHLSTALHEGTSFDDSFSEAFEEMREIFDGRVHFQGYLSDQAVYNRLLECTFFAAFFDEGVRANNTSVNFALEVGAVVITNLDADSPRPLVHGRTVIDINRCDSLPTHPAALAAIREEARRVGAHDLGWDALLERLVR
jgi:hypothetical protein